MPWHSVRLVPVVLLIAGAIILGLAVSLNIYSYLYPKQGEITVTLSEENDYSVVQPLFFNYHGYIDISLENLEPGSRVNVVVGGENYTLNTQHGEAIIVLGGGGYKLYFYSSGPAVLRIRVEDYLILPGENTLLLIAGIGLTLAGIVLTVYYARRKRIPL